MAQYFVKLRSLLKSWRFHFPKGKIVFKSGLAFCLGLAIALLIFKMTTVEIPILGFHDIIDLNNPEEQPPQRPSISGDYTKQKLADFIDYLLEKNYWFLSTQELYDYFLRENPQPIPPDRRGQKPIMLTFDDGYESAHNNLIAILEQMEESDRKKVKIVWFINSAFMGVRGSQLPHVSCEELKRGFQKGYYDIQSHGLNHSNLTELSPQKLDLELSKSQADLRECIDDLTANPTVASHLAYPFGAINPQVEQQVAKYYLSGYLYNSRILRPTQLKNRYLVPRLSVDEKMTLTRLKILAAGGWL